MYCRKSTEDEKKQVLSLSAQQRELEEFAKRKGLEIVARYSESASAKSLGRAEFAKMMQDLKSGKADGILT